MLRSGPTIEDIRLEGKFVALLTRGALHELSERGSRKKTKILSRGLMRLIVF